MLDFSGMGYLEVRVVTALSLSIWDVYIYCSATHEGHVLHVVLE